MWWSEGLSQWHQSYLEKRNDFWEHYGQVALAVLIVVVLAVLLLTKTITAEAGLPILSAVAGFAIAKTSSPVGRNKPVRAIARIGVSGVHRPNSPETPPRATLGWSYSGLR